MPANANEKEMVLRALRRGEIDQPTANEILDDLDWQGAEADVRGLSMEEARLLEALRQTVPSPEAVMAPPPGSAMDTRLNSLAGLNMGQVPPEQAIATTGGVREIPESMRNESHRPISRFSLAGLNMGQIPPEQAIATTGGVREIPESMRNESIGPSRMADWKKSSGKQTDREKATGRIGGILNMDPGPASQAAFMLPIQSTIQAILANRAKDAGAGVSDPMPLTQGKPATIEELSQGLPAGATRDQTPRGSAELPPGPAEPVPTEKPGALQGDGGNPQHSGRDLSILLGALGLGGVLAAAAGGKSKSGIEVKKVKGGTIVTSTYRESPATRLGKALGVAGNLAAQMEDRKLAMEELRVSQAKEAREERLQVGLSLIKAGQIEQGKTFLATDYPMLGEMISTENFDPEQKAKSYDYLFKAQVWKTLPWESQLQLVKDQWQSLGQTLPPDFENRFAEQANAMSSGNKAFTIASILKMADFGVVLDPETLRKAGVNNPEHISLYAEAAQRAKGAKEQKDDVYQMQQLSKSINERLLIGEDLNPEDRQLMVTAAQQLDQALIAASSRFGGESSAIESPLDVAPTNEQEYQDTLEYFGSILPDYPEATVGDLKRIALRLGLRADDPTLTEMIQNSVGGQ